ncbi:MAG: hypothetical protein PHE55_03245 [Methylococcaceae bacterium]|nr:hypothetical protein [Methylococcaceae bacterium]
MMVVAGLGACAGASTAARAGDAGEQVSTPSTGTDAIKVMWSVSGYVLGKDSDWSEDQARAMLFKPLSLEATRISFAGQTCTGLVSERSKVSAGEYLNRVYHTTPQALGIEQQELELVKTHCDIPGFREYLRLGDRRLLVYRDGVFFYFSPVLDY